MTDVVDIMVDRAWEAYQRYLLLPSTKDTLDFEAFSVGFFLGALSAVGKIPTHRNSDRGETE